MKNLSSVFVKIFGKILVKPHLWVFILTISLIIIGLSFFTNWGQAGQNELDQILRLRQEIKTLEEQIKELRESIYEEKDLEKSLKRQVSILENEIAKIELEIEKVDLVIEETEIEIEKKNQEIEELEAKIEKEKNLLKEVLQIIYEEDQDEFLEILLKNENLSEFFNDIRYLENLQASLQSALNRVKGFKQKLIQEKEDLEREKQKNIELKSLQILEKLTLEIKTEQKKQLLEETWGRESVFQKNLEEAREDVKKAKERLYVLQGFGISIKLSEAYELAKKVFDKTGVRPALILAVLKQESNLGSFVGTGNWRDDMHPRDWEAFLDITRRLGLNPDAVPVSRKPSYGWGGAMGPAQFLPNTWLAYEDKISELTGNDPPSPWDLLDAFAACALKLQNDGALSRDYASEWRAVMIYFAGSNWNNPDYSFYGDSVMDLADFFQEQINILTSSNQ